MTNLCQITENTIKNNNNTQFEKTKLTKSKEHTIYFTFWCMRILSCILEFCMNWNVGLALCPKEAALLV